MAVSNSRLRIKRGIRRKVNGTAVRPRISVFKSNAKIYAQIVDDQKGHTLVSASSAELGATKNTNVEVSKEVGKKLAEKATAAGISEVVFDRNGYQYHGVIAAFGDSLRANEIKF